MNEELPLDQSTRDKLQPELFPEERLLWGGRPLQGTRFRTSSADFVVFGVGILFLLTALILFLCLVGIIPLPPRQGPDSPEFQGPAILWIFILLPLGSLMAGGLQYLNARLRRHLFYGVTNERVLILRTHENSAQSLTSLSLQHIPHLKVYVEETGIGTVTFFNPINGSQPHHQGAYASFLLIPEARKVYSLIQAERRKLA